MPAPKKTELRMIAAEYLVTLKRNPQYLTPTQMDSLKASIQRDGFCAPILVRPHSEGRFEIISGNHRFMAATEIGMREIPCVVADMSDAVARRVAINLNTIHGNPTVELLAPFLAELDVDILRDVYLDDDFKRSVMEFDDALASTLAQLEAPDFVDRDSPQASTLPKSCTCPVCHTKHHARTTAV